MIPIPRDIIRAEVLRGFELTRECLTSALSEALKKIDKAIEDFGDGFPSPSSDRNVYRKIDNTTGWGCGFWTGMLFHAYELTGNEKYKEVALSHIPSFTRRIREKIGVDHHDMGFLYSPSCVAAYKLTGSTEARDAALMAADHLISRFHEKAGFIQAWGLVDSPDSYRLIIDCLLNIPLLYWASEVTGDGRYERIAYTHFKTTAELCCREDASTYHTYYFDRETGLPDRGVTHQGASDGSAWARGQAWGIYGPVLTYLYKKDENAVSLFRATASYFLNHLPRDLTPFWDLSFSDGSPEPRDSSAAAIAAAGMLEAVRLMPLSDSERELYRSAAERIIASLIKSYTTKDLPDSNGLLLHAVYSKPHGKGVDEMNIWGDYFYMEALHRLLAPDFKLYW